MDASSKHVFRNMLTSYSMRFMHSLLFDTCKYQQRMLPINPLLCCPRLLTISLVSRQCTTLPPPFLTSIPFHYPYVLQQLHQCFCGNRCPLVNEFSLLQVSRKKLPSASWGPRFFTPRLLWRVCGGGCDPSVEKTILRGRARRA